MDYSTFLNGICGAAYVSDENGRIVGWNTAAEQLLGYSANAVLGKPCYEVVRGRDLSGDRFCRKDCKLRQSMRHGEPICSFVFAARTASGTHLPVRCAAVAMCEEPQCEAFQILHVLDSTSAVAETTADPHRHGLATGQANRYATHTRAMLTQRETEVLKLLAGGRTTPEVAEALSVSINTIRTHTQNILHKLNAHTRLQAVIEARDRKLI